MKRLTTAAQEVRSRHLQDVPANPGNVGAISPFSPVARSAAGGHEFTG